MRSPRGNLQSGLSPRLRGNRSVSVHVVDRLRFYPRACGGTLADPILQLAPLGSIPAPAGNPATRVRRGSRCGSIPAPAGEPGRTFAEWRRDGSIPAPAGNPQRGEVGPHPRGSIPAPAGEPRRCPARCGAHQVYPRACGGTVGDRVRVGEYHGLSPRLRGNRFGMPSIIDCHGLSPRLRGNRVATQRAAADGRSIPAPAGEPCPRATRT